MLCLDSEQNGSSNVCSTVLTQKNKTHFVNIQLKFIFHSYNKSYFNTGLVSTTTLCIKRSMLYCNPRMNAEQYFYMFKYDGQVRYIAVVYAQES